jgi:hypothetical protein
LGSVQISSKRRDPTIGKVVVYRISGRTAELVSRTLQTVTCSATKGNVFAADQ